MQRAFEITMTVRKELSVFLQNYSLEQLNKVPDGFSNNLIWNIGHIVVVQQMLVYALSGLPMMVSPEMIAKFRKGTRPEGNVSQEEIDEIQSLLFTTIERTKTDLENGIFKEYREFTNMYGYTLKSAEDAIAFNYSHEMMHLGMMLMIRKFI